MVRPYQLCYGTTICAGLSFGTAMCAGISYGTALFAVWGEGMVCYGTAISQDSTSHPYDNIITVLDIEVVFLFVSSLLPSSLELRDTQVFEP